MKILLIDDDEAILKIFDLALKKEGYETEQAETGEEGLNKAKTINPNLILLDQVLPDMSGNEILKALKEQEETKNIPVVILSNFSQQELVKGAINEGAEDYIFKYQAEPHEVVAKIKAVLEKKEPNATQS